MCAVRNDRERVPRLAFILDHWEMCAVRNPGVEADILKRILDHWEMCAVRNGLSLYNKWSGILDHFEMRVAWGIERMVFAEVIHYPNKATPYLTPSNLK